MMRHYFVSVAVLMAFLQSCMVLRGQEQAETAKADRPAQQANKETKEQGPKKLKGLKVDNGQLTAQDPQDTIRQGCHRKVYELKMEPNVRYVIEMEGNFDTYIRVEDSKGANLAEDDDGGNGLNSRLVFTPTKADKYKIIATSCGPATGNFSLRVTPMVLGKVLLQKSGQLRADDPFDVMMQSSHHKMYNVRLEKGKTYSIELESNEFFPYLRLEDYRGNQLATSGGRFEQRRTEIILEAPETETYRVIVTSRAENQTGSFRLTIR